LPPSMVMNASSSAHLLEGWERALAQPAALRALTLLSVANNQEPIDVLMRLSIGQRDARLLRLREQTLGTCLNAITKCPACAETLEANFNVADVYVQPTDPTPSALTLELDGYVVAFRPPQAFDLAALEPDADLMENRQRILERCILSARRDDTEISAAELPEEIVITIATQMAEADPQADILIGMQCPFCAHHWRAPLDIFSFFWIELSAWAGRLLRDVDALASAYGWREADILALSPTRRQIYLELIGQ
jgi:hypothetical protein